MLDLLLATKKTASYATTSTASTGGSIFTLVWSIVALVLAVVGAFIIYFMFVKSKNEPKGKFLVWLKEFLDFKKMLIEGMLKIIYLFGALYLTIGSLALFGSMGAIAIVIIPLVIIIGNVILRLVYEGLLITIMIWKNTTEINKKMN